MNWTVNDYLADEVSHLRELDTRHMLETDPPAVEWQIGGICGRPTGSTGRRAPSRSA